MTTADRTTNGRPSPGHRTNQEKRAIAAKGPWQILGKAKARSEDRASILIRI